MQGFEFLEEEGNFMLEQIMSSHSIIAEKEIERSMSGVNNENVNMAHQKVLQDQQLAALRQCFAERMFEILGEFRQPEQDKLPIPKELFGTDTYDEQQSTHDMNSQDRTHYYANQAPCAMYEPHIEANLQSTTSKTYSRPQTAIRSGRPASRISFPQTDAFSWQKPLATAYTAHDQLIHDTPMPSSSSTIPPVVSTTTVPPSIFSTNNTTKRTNPQEKGERQKRGKEKRFTQRREQYRTSRPPLSSQTGPSRPSLPTSRNAPTQISPTENLAPPLTQAGFPQIATDKKKGKKKAPIVAPASQPRRLSSSNPQIPEVSASGSRKPPEVASTASTTHHDRHPGRKRHLVDLGGLSIEAIGTQGAHVVFRPNATERHLQKRLLGKPEEFDDAFYNTASKRGTSREKFIVVEHGCFVLYESGTRTIIGHVKEVHALIRRFFLTKDSRSHDY